MTRPERRVRLHTDHLEARNMLSTVGTAHIGQVHHDVHEQKADAWHGHDTVTYYTTFNRDVMGAVFKGANGYSAFRTSTVNVGAHHLSWGDIRAMIQHEWGYKNDHCHSHSPTPTPTPTPSPTPTPTPSPTPTPTPTPSPTPTPTPTPSPTPTPTPIPSPTPTPTPSPTPTPTPTPSPTPTPTPTDVPAPIAGQNYHLAFSDEFNDTSIDTSKWHRGGPWGETASVQTGALSTYTPANVNESGGSAHLVVNKDGQGNWKGAILNTDSTFDFKYGYVEVRAQVPKGQGLWPAIWLYNTDNQAEEIDMMEFLGGDPGTVYQTDHWAGGQKQFRSTTDDWSSAYHTYGLLWASDGSATFYLDGVKKGTVTGASDKTMYLMMNNDAGGSGSWGGSVDSSTPNPNQMNVDYVRIYQS